VKLIAESLRRGLQGHPMMVALTTREIEKLGTDFRTDHRSAPIRYQRIKWVLDLSFAFVLLVATAPIVLLCMILVRLSSRGRPLYKQERLGCLGRTFTMYKIRTMVVDCERQSGPIWSLPGDRRVTPIGRFLRWSHIDELPQLVNVLRGEMSLIGPRPERPEIVAQLERALPQYRHRLLIRPGLSGLAQVLQGPDTDLQSVWRKLGFDLLYLDRMSFRLDLQLMLATLLCLAHVSRPAIARLCGFGEVRSASGQ
jgi:lipopolysaccharide/colanic/teichoic acid biosynthesis glycosyltransferase